MPGLFGRGRQVARPSCAVGEERAGVGLDTAQSRYGELVAQLSEVAGRRPRSLPRRAAKESFAAPDSQEESAISPNPGVTMGPAWR